jgi:hypothetical protein
MTASVEGSALIQGESKLKQTVSFTVAIISTERQSSHPWQKQNNDETNNEMRDTLGELLTAEALHERSQSTLRLKP